MQIRFPDSISFTRKIIGSEIIQQFVTLEGNVHYLPGRAPFIASHIRLKNTDRQEQWQENSDSSQAITLLR